MHSWRSRGAGFVGDGYFRFVDPARAATMHSGVFGLPDGATVLFTTGLGDIICHVNGLHLVVKSRFGAIDVVQGEAPWEWQLNSDVGSPGAVLRHWPIAPGAHVSSVAHRLQTSPLRRRARRKLWLPW
ncbi:hypothetical protein GCM10009679_18300 [Saccharothrix algeriensis]|uniref:Uncharacterized protein n=1 Tax=Catellatospora bangladeshensis TaxID=310355 RepID=A0A8J3NMD8_9ACTN|nr:hypothetical protein Cba03nite_74160 [Catellatospora bangladeshensis]